MTKYGIDAYAWIEYIDGTEKGRLVGQIVEDDKNRIYTCAVTYAEVISKMIRQGKNPELAKEAMMTFSHIIVADEVISEAAAHIHARLRKKNGTFGLADAFVVAMAEKMKLIIVTGDKHFEDVKNVIMV